MRGARLSPPVAGRGGSPSQGDSGGVDALARAPETANDSRSMIDTTGTFVELSDLGEAMGAT